MARKNKVRFLELDWGLFPHKLLYSINQKNRDASDHNHYEDSNYE